MSCRPVFVLLVVVIAFSLPLRRAFATTWAPLSDAVLCDTADRIVIGRIEGDSELRIHVSETLKGEHEEDLSVGSGQLKGEQMFYSGSTGLFFLRRVGKQFIPFNPACFQAPEKVPRIREVLLMYSDPARFAAHPDSPLDPDVAYVLGRLFAGFAITSPEISTIGEHMRRFAEPYYVQAPWDQKQAVRLTCRHMPKSDPPIMVVTAEPEGELSTFLADRMRTASKWNYVQATLVPEFSLRLDADNPPRVGSLTYPQAITYLHRCLATNELLTLETAFTSLAEIRDTTAIPAVIALLSHESKQVQFHAVQFLGYSKDGRAVQPLADLLRRVSPHYPKDHEIANAACDALALSGDPGAISALEFAARNGVEFAGYALGKIGTAETFPVLLDCYLKHPEPPASFPAGMLWLVMRSNKAVEKWMKNPTYTSAIGIEEKPLWKEWWQKNRGGFQVVRSMREAVALQQKPR